MQKRKKYKIFRIAAVCALLLSGCTEKDSQSIWEEPVSLQSETQILEETPMSAETETELFVVDISGAVVHPGVYRLEQGSRICDAVEMAGGLLADADRDSLNQAAPLQDGAKIMVYTVQEAETAANAAGAVIYGEGGAQAAAKININTADLAQLCTLTGIGESRAKDIIAYREQNGPFAAVEDIMNVSGIKEATFNKIKEEIAVG